jgi:ribosomal protein S18 acetylase RimI-like enzyme
MVDALDFDIRYSTATDLPYLKEWVSQPNMLCWFPMSSSKEIDDAVHCWIGFSKFNCSLTATVNGTPCAVGTLFLMPYRKVAHHCMFKIAVDPSFQRKGIGSSLIKNLKHLAKQYFRLEFLHVEVFEGNPLLSLLERQGFKELMRQPKYVKQQGRYLARILLEADLRDK